MYPWIQSHQSQDAWARWRFGLTIRQSPLSRDRRRVVVSGCSVLLIGLARYSTKVRSCCWQCDLPWKPTQHWGHAMSYLCMSHLEVRWRQLVHVDKPCASGNPPKYWHKVISEPTIGDTDRNRVEWRNNHMSGLHRGLLIRSWLQLSVSHWLLFGQPIAKVFRLHLHLNKYQPSATHSGPNERTVLLEYGPRDSSTQCAHANLKHSSYWSYSWADDMQGTSRWAGIR